MGKIKILLIILASLIGKNCYAQFLEVGFKVVYRPNLDDTTKVKEDYVLSLNNEKKESLFTYFDLKNALKIKIYKNIDATEFIQYESIMDRVYKTKYKHDNLSWQLLDGEKKILGYICHRAQVNFGGRDWEAWYAYDIPLQDGPYKFFGLPGLILEIFSKDGDYYFTANSILNKDNTFNYKIAAIQFQSTEQQIKFKQEIINDPAIQYRKDMQRLKESNMGVNISFDGKQITPKDSERMIVETFKSWMKEHNNPIEKGSIWIK